jgi:hypothetical protein
LIRPSSSVQRLLQPLRVRHDRFGMRVLRREIGDHLGVGAVAHPEVVVVERASVDRRRVRDLLRHGGRGLLVGAGHRLRVTRGCPRDRGRPAEWSIAGTSRPWTRPSRFHPDGPLHHLDVPVAPLLDALVEVHQPLAELGVLRIPAIDVDQDRLQLGRRLDGGGHIASARRVGIGYPSPARYSMNGVPQRGLRPATLERRPRAGPLAKAVDGRPRLEPQDELELAELVRLEPAGRLEPVPEAQKLERRHRLQNVELRHHHL